MTLCTLIHIAQGQVVGHQGTRFAGICRVAATNSTPAQVCIAVRYDTRELTVRLHEGEAVSLPRQTWRLDAIHATSRRWHAMLTRVG